MLGALRAEWVKFRSSGLCVASVASALVVPGVLAYLLLRQSPDANGSFAVLSCLYASQFSQFCAIVLGAGMAGLELRGSSLRTSLVAVPRRLDLLGAKVIIFGILCLLASFIGNLVAVISSVVPRTSDTELLRQVIRLSARCTISWVMLGLLALLLTIVVRSSVASIAVLGLLLLGGSQVIRLATEWARFLPDMAGMGLFVDDSSFLKPWPGVAVQAAWVVVALVCAGYLFVHRDVR